jgi:hypothetical protein
MTEIKGNSIETAINCALNESNSINERINQLSHQYNNNFSQTPQNNKQEYHPYNHNENM